jgi:hypothetical protein
VTSPLNPSQSSARQILLDQLHEWGLDTLAPAVDELIKQGLDAPAVTLQLQETPQYKERFKANEIRRQKGLPVLSPADYVSTEAAYRSVLRTYGLPSGFYDSHDDFNQFLGNDVSPDELNQRARVAQQVWLSNDAETRAGWTQFYGLSGGAAIASILDPEKALPIIQRQAEAAQFGASAERQGLQADRARLERYADLGISQETIDTGFSRIANTQAVDQKLAARFGQTPLTQGEQEAEQFLGDAQAARKRAGLYQNEEALFKGRAGAGDQSLQRQQNGRF